MSSKNVKKPSIEGDRYYSPPWCVKQCIEIVLPEMQPYNDAADDVLHILEPSAGSGSFLRPLRKTYPNAIIHAMDLDTTVGPWPEADISARGDFLWCWTPEVPPAWEIPLPHYDLIVGNPPFGLSFEFIQRSVAHAYMVVYLLRIGFLASEERREWLIEHPPSHLFPLAHRPSFTRDGKTDSADYAFICWKRSHEGPTELHLLPTVPQHERKISAHGVLAYEDGKEVSVYHDRLF